MTNNNNNIDYYVLDAISKSTVPVGSGYIRDALKLREIDISEATAGRILRDCDLLGYTERMGFKGRVLTQQGRKKLQDLEKEYNRNYFGIELINVIKVKEKKELIDILVARKAIEREIAKLAAENITDEQVKELEEILTTQQIHSLEDLAIAKEDASFHKMIAKIAGNKILETAMDLIRHDTNMTPIFEFIRKKVRSTIVLDHIKILKALSERNPQKAEEAMICHLDNLIQDVNKYWSEMEGS